MSRQLQFSSQNAIQHGYSVAPNPTPSTIMASNSIKLLTGNSHPALAKAVAARLVLAGVA